jgi:predicted dehydrogenase
MSGIGELRVAIVGCGIIGVNHARAIARTTDLGVTVLVDAVVDAAEQLADLIRDDTGAERPAVFSDLGSALTAGEIDVVVICTPSGLHVALAEQALAAGAHVVIEKPLDVALPRARRIAELAAEAESRGLVVTVISQHRFDPASVVVAEAAHSGAFGRLTSGVASVAWWRSQDYYDSGQWRGTWELDGGGAVMNQGVHTVDLLAWFFGRPVEISAQTALLAHERVEIEDVAVATIRFESGALAVVHATTSAYPGLSVRLQVHGSHGSAVIDNDKLAYFAATDHPEEHPSGAGVADRGAELVGAEDLAGGSPGANDFILGHERQYRDIVEAIRDGRHPGVRVEDALHALALVRAIYVSGMLGKAVLFDDVLRGDYDDLAITIGPAA